MTSPEALSYTRAAARIGRIIIALSIAGTVTAMVLAGWKGAAGFLLGAGVSALNFRWLRRLVDSLGSPNPPKRRSVILAFRYLILGGAAYVILRFTSINVPAVWAGVFVLTAAVIVESIIEIVYARK
jgi:hypothetical protein